MLSKKFKIMEKLYSSKTLLKSGWWGDAYPQLPTPWIRPCSFLAQTSYHTMQQLIYSTFKWPFFKDRKTAGMDHCIIINKFSE